MTDAAKMIVEEKMDKLSAVYKEALDRLKGLSSQLTDLPAAELKKKVDQIVGMYFLLSNHQTYVGFRLQLRILYRHILMSCFRCTYNVSVAHKIVTDDIQTELVSELTKLFGHVLSHHPSVKRNSFTDALSSLGSGLANFFQPHVQAIQQVVFYIKCDYMVNAL